MWGWVEINEDIEEIMGYIIQGFYAKKFRF